MKIIKILYKIPLTRYSFCVVKVYNICQVYVSYKHDPTNLFISKKFKIL